MQPVNSTTQTCAPPPDPDLRLWRQFLREQGEIQRLVKTCSFIIYDDTWLLRAKETNTIQKFEHWNEAAYRRISDKNYHNLIIDPFEEIDRVNVVLSAVIVDSNPFHS